MNTVEIIDPRFKALTLPNAPLLTLGEGFAWLEGPVWLADTNQLLVSDLPNNRLLRWTEESGVSVFEHPSGFANGHTRDREGRLISCSNELRGLTRRELDGSVTMLVDRFEGKRLNGPNDVVVDSQNNIWFSDPLYGGSTDYEGGKHATELPPRVYRFEPKTSSLTVVADNFEGPNGVAFSPDEKLLYIAESGSQFAETPTQHIQLHDVIDLKTLARPRLFHKVSPGYADGFRADEGGRIWTGAADGVHCINPDGTLLGKIYTGCAVSNLTFGGRNRSRLFICASQTLMAIYTNTRGAERP